MNRETKLFKDCDKLAELVERLNLKKLEKENYMTKKFCDICGKEIKGKYYYYVVVYKETERGSEVAKESEICPACYKKIRWRNR